jgi:hypothetical protein
MIIDKIGRSERDGCSNVECEIRLESGNGGSHRIFASTEPPQTLEADPNGFLLGAFLPAWTAGESRIRIEGPICPVLSANLTVAASVLRTWYRDLPAPPAIECDYEYRTPGTRTGAFLSGGVDSLAMLRGLTSRKPAGHPDRPTAAIVVDYQYMGGVSRAETDARFARSTATSREICADIGLDVIPVRSNFCQLNGGMDFWMRRYHGAFLASMAHFLGRDFRLFYIAATYTAAHMAPWGSHPQLDPLYSSQHVRISHDGIELSRLDKVMALRDWPAALDRMYVCISGTSNGVNCGRCEKCVRTRLHLLVAGVLTEAGAFGGADLSERDIRAVRIRTEYKRACFEETLPALRRLGRHDLASAVEHIVNDYVLSASPVHRRLMRRATRKLKRSLPHWAR